jgi:hypothetical protein
MFFPQIDNGELQVQESNEKDVNQGGRIRQNEDFQWTQIMSEGHCQVWSDSETPRNRILQRIPGKSAGKDACWRNGGRRRLKTNDMKFFLVG